MPSGASGAGGLDMRTLGKLLLAWVILASTLALYLMVKPAPVQTETPKVVEKQESGLDLEKIALCNRGIIPAYRCN